MTSFQFPPALIDALRGSRRVVVLTGAGVSAESGVPTFRDAQTGLWAKYRPEDLATPEAFQRNPKLVWDWYASRRARLAQVEPNAGHRALVQPAASLPYAALQRGAMLVEINPDTTALTHDTTFHLRGPSGQVLPALLRAVFGPQTA